VRILFWTLMVLLVAVPAFGGVVAPNLGSAFTFGLLTATIDNGTFPSVVTGNVGATITITGFPPGTAVGGTAYTAPNDPTSPVGLAYTSYVNAFALAISDVSTQVTQPPVNGLAGGHTFFGNNVYKFDGTDVSSVAGATLTFDANGDSSEIFIIKVARDLTINAPITFFLTNQARASNIYWIIGRTAVISGETAVTPVTWDGNLLAGTSFTMSGSTGGATTLTGTINGCVYAGTPDIPGTVTLAGPTDIGGCAGATGSIPEPGSSGLVALGCLLGALGLRKFRSVRQTR
jgi:hypothetical protein